MRIAMFGGSYNPIHCGHIQIAAAVREKYNIDDVLFIVAGDPPHKSIACGVKAEDRLAMARIALKGAQGIQACDMELKRPGKSYTADTLKLLRSLYPGGEICCIIGADMLLTLDTWHDADELLRLAKFIAAGRPDSPGVEEAAERLRRQYGADIAISEITGPALSSTMVRQAVERGESTRNMIPPAVEDYIYQHGLYFPKDVDAIRGKLQRELSPERYAHTMRVVQAALKLAQRYGASPVKTRLGALLHDCAKLKPEVQLRLAAEYGLDVSSMPLSIIHGAIGAERARREFGVDDKEILGAIGRHTVCGPAMTDLDKIVYLADKIEKDRTYEGVDEIRKAAERSLDEGMIECIERSLGFLAQKGAQAHPCTLAVLAELKDKQSDKNKIKEEKI